MTDPVERGLTIRLGVAAPPAEAFEMVIADLTDAMQRQGFSVSLGPQGRILQNGTEVGTVETWEPASRAALRWRATNWGDPRSLEIRLGFSPAEGGTEITCEVRGWGGLLRDDGGELAAWFGSGLLAPLFYAVSPDGLGDWMTDRTVRRPTGPWARATYADPLFHWPNFLLILDRLELRPEDTLLEVGCGGGAFLHKALESGCRATGIDHSGEMVRLATAQNRDAVARGTLMVLMGEADRLPVPDATFSCAVMTGVIGFLPDPVAALREIHRALRPGGRIVVFGGTAALRGTPAAPEPFASRIRFFDVPEIEEVARQAGFVEVRADTPDMESYARTAGVPVDALPMFRRTGGGLVLTARKE